MHATGRLLHEKGGVGVWGEAPTFVKGPAQKVPIFDVNKLRPDPYSRARHAALVRDLEADG